MEMPPWVLLMLILLASGMKTCKGASLPVDCSDIYHQDKNLTNGVFTIYPNGSTSAVMVYCDLESEEGRWTVFQNRMDGSVNFYRGWDQYKLGFGNAVGEYWLGLENIHQLTRQKKYELLVDMEDFEGNKTFARYSAFSVDAERDGYELNVSGFHNGGAGDSLIFHNGMKFTTFDKDQDDWYKNCAREYLGAFWYDKCHGTNPNGIYHWGADDSLFAVGVNWLTWKGHEYSLKTISMKIRPVN
ncbi:microfibril-associated glycoprotein 4-like [Cololabis saira]|uniref:microfibril-associated glycoprotein 4-like n=1 Tax=Cololabis saira TaxID=129043 RepID=UPI002AD2CB38|nr:microfibril-associated glycoprotein 4-like [Cololabis saira]